ncbi:selenide water dikinase [Pelomyxa schiedti]|nr:selenide water dikinase [Pelomyxa schiedti]
MVDVIGQSRDETAEEAEEDERPRGASAYLDYNASCPIDGRVAERMSPFLYQHFGNPSSSHAFGRPTKKAVEEARKSIAAMLGCEVTEVFFTSGGTESNNWAIKGAAFANRNRGNHIITSAIEHPAILEVCKWLQTQGFEVTVVGVDQYGSVNPVDIERAISPRTILISVMHANNEVGTVQSIKEIARIAHRHGILMHTDAAQSIGKVPVSVRELEVDLLSMAGHKLYAPKGVGALFIRSGISLDKFMHGADHEQKRRAGTENVLEISGLGAAAVLVTQHLHEDIAHFTSMKQALRQGLEKELGPHSFRVNGNPEMCLPNTLSVSFRGVEANTLLSEIGEKVAASPGAACHSESVSISHVLKAMNVPMEFAMGTVRFSVGRPTTLSEINFAVAITSAAVKRLQPQTPTTAPVLLNDDDTDVTKFKLTEYTRGMGCACKLRPQALEKVLASLPKPKTKDPNVIVGTETGDDAAVYILNENQAIVSTVDFFTPVCDSAYWFGAISAANSMSDIWAMGGSVAFALNVVGFPSNRLPMKVLHEILRGAQDKADEAGISIIGGHTVDDTEPKFGLAVTGFVNPNKVLRNCNATPGCSLILTKPLGTGILSTGIKKGILSKSNTEELYHWMATLNRSAGEVASAEGAVAATDITGFGFLGHLLGMTRSSRIDAEIWVESVPLLPSARELAVADIIPTGSRDNLLHVQPHVTFAPGVSPIDEILLADSQTSGGLLICVPMDKKDALIQALKARSVECVACVGRTMEGSGRISVIPRAP